MRFEGPIVDGAEQLVDAAQPDGLEPGVCDDRRPEAFSWCRREDLNAPLNCSPIRAGRTQHLSRVIA